MRNILKIAGAIAFIAAGSASASPNAGAASGDTLGRSQRLQAELNRGRNYADAWSATSVPVDADDVLGRARSHADAMNAGKDHSDARSTSTRDAAAVTATAHRHQQAMNMGLDHEDARTAAGSGR